MKKAGTPNAEPRSAIGSCGVSEEGAAALWPPGVVAPVPGAGGCPAPPPAEELGAWRRFEEPALELCGCWVWTLGGSSLVVVAGGSEAGGAGWLELVSGCGSATVVVTEGGGAIEVVSASAAGAVPGSASMSAAVAPALISRWTRAVPI